MATTSRRSEPGRVFDPHATAIPRRSMLVLMGAGATVVATGGLGAVLAACAAPPVSVALDVDPSTLAPGVPTEVPFEVTESNGAKIPGSTWLLRAADGTLVAYDPRCTHGLCRYSWKPETAHFKCACHEGEYDIDGKVVAGPPPRPLMRFPVTETATGITVSVPGDFQTPRESLPA